MNVISFNLIGNQELIWLNQFLANYHLTIVLSIITVIALCFKTRRKAKLPPGPWGLPFLGYGPFLGPAPYLTFLKLSKKFGDVIQINIYGQKCVILGSYESMKDAFIKNGEHFVERPSGFNFWRELTGSKGVLMSNGGAWKSNRKLCISSLSKLGVGKLELENRLRPFTLQLIDYVKDKKGQAFDILNIFANVLSNGMSDLLLSKTFDQEDLEFAKFRDHVIRTLLIFTSTSEIMFGAVER